MHKKAILYIITKCVVAGAPLYVLNLVKNLPKDQFQTIIIGGGKGSLRDRIKEAEIPYYHVKYFQRSINPLKDILAFFNVLFLIIKIKPDIIHTNSSKGGGIGGLAGRIYSLVAGKKVRLVFTAHGWAYAEDRPRWQLYLIKLISQITSLLHHKVICVSEYDRKLALNHNLAPNNKLITIYNGINTDIQFLDKKEAQMKLMDKTSDFVIGTIAEWIPNKGLFYFLDAIKKINCDVVIITGGENPDKDEAYRYIKEREIKNVYLHEDIKNAANYLKAFNIFILPSLKEGLPYTIIEAMLAQLPIIASNVGGIPEMIEDNKNGLLISPKNSQEIIEKINWLKHHPEEAQDMALEAKNRAIRLFNIQSLIQNTETLYNDL